MKVCECRIAFVLTCSCKLCLNIFQVWEFVLIHSSDKLEQQSNQLETCCYIFNTSWLLYCSSLSDEWIRTNSHTWKIFRHSLQLHVSTNVSTNAILHSHTFIPHLHTWAYKRTTLCTPIRASLEQNFLNRIKLPF